MRRRKSGAEEVAEGMFEIFLRTPWWVCPIVAAVIFVIFRFVFPALGDPKQISLSGLFANVSKMIAPFFAILVLIIGGLAELKKWERRRLLDKQRGLDTIRAMNWRDFELLVGEAYRRKGYSVEVTGQGGADGGIDLILKWQGGTAIVQCKHWRDQQVGVTLIRELFGVMTHMGAQRGILVTCGTFTPDAYAFAKGKPIELVNGNELVALVREVQTPEKLPQAAAVGNPPVITETNASESVLCPDCGNTMVVRTARKGAHAGLPFWGCSQFPKCRGTRNID